MDAYVYDAVMLCEYCGQRKRVDILEARGCSDEDSNRWPQGPYADGGGEADCPQHCDCCGVFLGNPLTSDGYKYVKGVLTWNAQNNHPDNECAKEWREYYSFDDDGNSPEEY